MRRKFRVGREGKRERESGIVVWMTSVQIVESSINCCKRCLLDDPRSAGRSSAVNSGRIAHKYPPLLPYCGVLLFQQKANLKPLSCKLLPRPEKSTRIWSDTDSINCTCYMLFSFLWTMNWRC